MAALPMAYAVYVEGAGWKELPRWAQSKIEAIARRRSEGGAVSGSVSIRRDGAGQYEEYSVNLDTNEITTASTGTVRPLAERPPATPQLCTRTAWRHFDLEVKSRIEAAVAARLPTEVAKCRDDGTERHQRWIRLTESGGLAWANTQTKCLTLDGKGPHKLLGLVALDLPSGRCLRATLEGAEDLVFRPKADDFDTLLKGFGQALPPAAEPAAAADDDADADCADAQFMFGEAERQDEERRQQDGAAAQTQADLAAAQAQIEELEQQLAELRPQLPASPVPAIIEVIPDELSGWLYKAGEWHTAWKKRFFKLGPDRTLYYYASEEDAEDPTRAKGCIDLSTINQRTPIEQDPSKPLEFRLLPAEAGGRTWHLKALEEEACGVATWRSRFEAMCKRVSARARASQPPRHRQPRRSHSPRRARASPPRRDSPA